MINNEIILFRNIKFNTMYCYIVATRKFKIMHVRKKIMHVTDIYFYWTILVYQKI